MPKTERGPDASSGANGTALVQAGDGTALGGMALSTVALGLLGAGLSLLRRAKGA